MTDGGREDTSERAENASSVIVRRWTRTLPPVDSPQTSHQQLATQFQQFVHQLAVADDFRVHSVDTLGVFNATAERDYRWLSAAHKLSEAAVSRQILGLRSELHSSQQDSLDHRQWLDLAHLADFHDFRAEEDLLRDKHNAVKPPNRLYARKSTGRRSSASVLPPPRDGYVSKFRILLESHSSQSTSIDSFHQSTPRSTRSSQRIAAHRSPLPAPPLSSSPAATSSSPIVTTGKRVTRNLPAGRTQNAGPAAPQGRQPLQLATTSRNAIIMRDDPDVNAAKGGATKGPRKRPLTSKAPPRGIPVKAEDPKAAAGNVISKARRLHHFGGSWPLKGKAPPLTSSLHEDEEDSSIDEHSVERSEQIEDFTIVLDETRTTLAEVEASTSELRAASLDGPNKVPNVSSPRGPPLPSTSNETSMQVDGEGDALDLHEFLGQADVSMPDITLTLPTSPVNASTGLTRNALATAPLSSSTKHDVVPHLRAGDEILADQEQVSLQAFLTLALGSASGSVGSDRMTAPLRPARSKSLSSMARARWTRLFVPETDLTSGGPFGKGYLGPGRRGYWSVKLLVDDHDDHIGSSAVILGLTSAFAPQIHKRGTIVWTLSRLRFFVQQVQQMNSSGNLGLITISVTPDRQAGLCIKLGCQATAALVLRSAFGAFSCAVDETLGGTEAAGITQEESVRWLAQEDGVTMVWWDEVNRCRVLEA